MKYTSLGVALANRPSKREILPNIDFDADYYLPEMRVNYRDGSLLRLIPAGAFILGSAPGEESPATIAHAKAMGPNSEAPQCRLILPAFYLGVFAVTNEQFALFLSESRPNPQVLRKWLPRLGRILPPAESTAGYRVEGGYEEYPIVHVSWFGADSYAKWAGLRLPREIEWEKAARGTDGRTFPWGGNWDASRLSWPDQSSGRVDAGAPVDAHSEGCSPYGIFQMLGNVEEWCSDLYDPETYARYSNGDLQPLVAGHQRVLRGGSFGRDKPQDFRCALRQSSAPIPAKDRLTGLRCASGELLWSSRHHSGSPLIAQ